MRRQWEELKQERLIRYDALLFVGGLLLLIAIMACNGAAPPPDPPPPPPPCEPDPVEPPREGCEWDDAVCLWACPPPPPPVTCQEARGESCVVIGGGECMCPQDYFFPWLDEDGDTGVAKNIFARKPYPKSTYERAIMSVDQEVLWNGVRQLRIALDCEPWPWNGKTKKEAARVIAQSQSALNRLHHFIHLQGSPKPPVILVKGGNWVKRHDSFPARSKVRRAFFNEFWQEQMIPAWHDAQSFDGVSDELCQ